MLFSSSYQCAKSLFLSTLISRSCPYSSGNISIYFIMKKSSHDFISSWSAFRSSACIWSITSRCIFYFFSASLIPFLTRGPIFTTSLPLGIPFSFFLQVYTLVYALPQLSSVISKSSLRFFSSTPIVFLEVPKSAHIIKPLLLHPLFHILFFICFFAIF